MYMYIRIYMNKNIDIYIFRCKLTVELIVENLSNGVHIYKFAYIYVYTYTYVDEYEWTKELTFCRMVTRWRLYSNMRICICTYN